MKVTHLYLSLLVFSTVGVLVNAFDPFTIAAVFGVGATLAPLGWKAWGYLRESCNAHWIDLNPTGLKTDLENKLFGQHIATSIIVKAVTGFMRNDNPKKPLVLSLHGPTGTGKNFVSQLIADNIYKKRNISRFFHTFTYQLDFPDASKTETYKAQLRQWIKGNVSNCARSMFVFDEVDKIHPGVIDSIQPYLDYHTKLEGVSYQKAIFIFLSNTGAEGITQTTLEFWEKGQDRREIKLKDLEKSISLSAFNNKMGGLWQSPLIEKNLVDFFVPFLPLEYGHVLQCIMASMTARDLKPDKQVAKQLADDLVYFPKPVGLFSTKGCKTIDARLDYYL